MQSPSLQGLKTSRLQIFQPDWSLPKLCACSENLTFESNLVDLGVPEEYHDFTDVFSRVKSDTLAPHWPYNLKIIIEDGTLPPQPLIYSLSTSELETLQEFLDKHLNIGFSWPSSSLHSPPILFVKKKDGSLTVQMLIPTYIRTLLPQHHFQLSFTIASSHSQHSYTSTQPSDSSPFSNDMLTPEFIPMQHLDTCDNQHV